MDQQAQTNQGQSAIKTNYVYPGQQVPIFKSYANQKIIISGSNCSVSNGDILSWDDWANGRGKFKHAYDLNTNSVVTATVEDAAIDNATGKILNLHLTFSDFHFIPDNMQDYSGNPNQVDNHKTFLSFLIPAGGGLIAADTNNISTFVVKQSFTYADGTPYQGKSLMYVSSLDKYKTVDHAEFIHPQSGVEAAFVPDGSSILTNQQSLHGTAASIANEGYIMPSIEEYPNNMKDSSIIFLANAESSYVMGIDNPRGGDVIATLPNGLKNNDGQAITFGANALQVQYPKTTEVHYHYNPSAIDLHFPNNIDALSI